MDSSEKDPRLQAADNELRDAGDELGEAQIRYHEAILARIALREILREESRE